MRVQVEWRREADVRRAARHIQASRRQKGVVPRPDGVQGPHPFQHVAEGDARGVGSHNAGYPALGLWGCVNLVSGITGRPTGVVLRATDPLPSSSTWGKRKRVLRLSGGVNTGISVCQPPSTKRTVHLRTVCVPERIVSSGYFRRGMSRMRETIEDVTCVGIDIRPTPLLGQGCGGQERRVRP